jgi:hypothetical protein
MTMHPTCFYRGVSRGLTLFLSILAGCADGPVPRTDGPMRPVVLDDGETAPPASMATIDRVSDDRAFPPWDWASLATATARLGRPVLCLEFNGATISDEDSFIISPGTTVHVPPFDALDLGFDDRGAVISALIGRVRGHFVFTDLDIVDVCPAGTAHTRIIVGGDPSLIGESSGVAGIAPFDVGNRMEDDIGFVFTEAIATGRGAADLDAVAATIAHEAGHTFGLDHVQPVVDLMHPTIDERMAAFTAALTLDGHWQDAPALLVAALGERSAGDTGHGVGSDPTTCDPPEERSGRSRDAARPIDADALPHGGRTCAGDEDWYAVDLRLGETVTLTLTYPDEAWVEPPALYKPRGRRPVGEGSASPGEHRWTYRAVVDGRHRIRITTPEEAAVRYALRFTRP